MGSISTGRSDPGRGVWAGREEDEVHGGGPGGDQLQAGAGAKCETVAEDNIVQQQYTEVGTESLQTDCQAKYQVEWHQAQQ